MKISKNKNIARGFTLVETIIYIGLLSGVLSTFIPYSVTMNEDNLRLLNNINDFLSS